MKTAQNTTPHQQSAQTKPSKKKDSGIDYQTAMKALERFRIEFEPLLKFHKEAEKSEMDDVAIYWNVKAIRGKDTEFAHTHGTSTLNGILAPHNMGDAMFIVEQEILNKITGPIVRAFQDEVSRVALEERAAKDAALDLDDMANDDMP